MLAKAWRMVAFVHGVVCHWQETADALEHGIGCAREAEDARQVARLSASYIFALSEGPTPAPVAIDRSEEVLRLGLVDRQAEGRALVALAPLHAMSGDFGRARELIARGDEVMRDLGSTVLASRTSDAWSRIDLMAGDLAGGRGEAPRRLRRPHRDRRALRAAEHRRAAREDALRARPARRGRGARDGRRRAG